MSISTVLLDAGGVILDESTQEDKQAAIVSEIIAEYCSGYSLDDYRRDIDEAVAAFCPDVYQYVLQHNLKHDNALYLRAADKHRASWVRERPPLVLMPGLADEVRAISARFALGIAGQYGRELLECLQSEDLLDSFSHQFTQDDFTITKPDPRYYEQICSAIGVEPSACLMVGDRIDKDIIPARTLGMKTIRIRTGLHRRQEARTAEEHPDAELPGIKGLGKAIERLAV